MDDDKIPSTSKKNKNPRCSKAGGGKHSNNKNSSVKNSLEHSSSQALTSRMPFRCPISYCNQIFGTTEVLSHYLRDHGAYEFQVKEVFNKDPAHMVISIMNMSVNCNGCLGILVFGGSKRVVSSNDYIKHLNPVEPSFNNYLPVIVMICKTSNLCLIGKSGFDDEPSSRHPAFVEQNIHLIWLATIETFKPLHCVITAYDNTMKIRRSKIVKVRQLSDSQDPYDFASNDSNFLLLRHSEVQKLSNNNGNTINIKLILNDSL